MRLLKGIGATHLQRAESDVLTARLRQIQLAWLQRQGNIR